MLQSIFFTVFLFADRFSRQMPCWQGLLLEATHDKRLVPSYGIFSSRLSVLVPSHPMPYHPGLLPSRLQRASWFRRLASSCPNFLHPERSARWHCKVFPLTYFLLQIKDLPRWWIRWTDGLYRGPTQEKNYLLLAGIEPGSPSCKSNVLPLDHGLPLMYAMFLIIVYLDFMKILIVLFLNFCNLKYVFQWNAIWIILNQKLFCI